ncbi:MAG: SAM-dependent methyltransferase [Silicimonas sp.]|nr:SAM-dependent methyltransferase [Silicimonas sp.]
MTGIKKLNDRPALLRNRARTQPEALFLHREAADEIAERLDEVNKSFTKPALVGHVTTDLVACFPDSVTVSDDERLSLRPSSHDLVVHAFALHWADDPIGQMVQSRLALVPDGLFIGVMFGGETLNELRTSLAEAEIKLTGGLSPRVVPMADMRDLGGLLQRAGFALPVADSRKLTVRYLNMRALMHDLRGMGETNALIERRRAIPTRALFSEAEEIYAAHFADRDGYLRATFELVYLTGWSPSDTQQKPLQPGSAQARLADALGVDESRTGDPVTLRKR